MGEARCRENWTHTSEIVAMMINVNRDPRKSPPVLAAELNPYRIQRPTRMGRKAGFEMLKAVFVDGKPGGTP